MGISRLIGPEPPPPNSPGLMYQLAIAEVATKRFLSRTFFLRTICIFSKNRKTRRLPSLIRV